MPEDKVEKLLNVKTKKGSIYMGVRTECGGKYNEVWKYFLNGKSGSVPAAYVSRKRLAGLNKVCVGYASTTQDKTSLDYRKKLEGLLKTERNIGYSGKNGYFVRLVKKNKVYSLHFLEAELQTNVSDVVGAQETPDFEEFMDEIAADSSKGAKAAQEAKAAEKSRKEEYGLQLKVVDGRRPTHYTSDVKPSPVPVQSSSAVPSAGPLTLAQSSKARVAQRTPTSKHEGKAKKFTPIKSSEDTQHAAGDVLRKSFGGKK